ncbi:hypothetical protein Ari01nite_18400 [Paractinoplanes rishiriensis]|uniref:Uncharacterized protein n=1 Tax=Paractinoplanes rishiriensis TaxID=1050105 RepID=A0A919JVI3_9ACTN|nr:hypothetical protein Ari01nite_18400 [Actinoplanes rishiriensis]
MSHTRNRFGRAALNFLRTKVLRAGRNTRDRGPWLAAPADPGQAEPTHQPGQPVPADLDAGPAQGVGQLPDAVDAVVRRVYRADRVAQRGVGAARADGGRVLAA